MTLLYFTRFIQRTIFILKPNDKLTLGCLTEVPQQRNLDLISIIYLDSMLKTAFTSNETI